MKNRQWVKRREKGLRMRNTRRNLSLNFFMSGAVKLMCVFTDAVVCNMF